MFGTMPEAVQQVAQSSLAAKRLRREATSLIKSPVPNIEAVPLETNILEWHYVIHGTAGTDYEGGCYHGMLKFPPEYPLKPPSVIMVTASGRFKTNRRLCLSMSGACACFLFDHVHHVTSLTFLIAVFVVCPALARACAAH